MSCSTSEKIVKIGAHLRKLSQKRNGYRFYWNTLYMMMMQQQLEETDADQKRDITSLKERLMMGQEAYQELFVNRENLLSELNKLKSRIAICYQK